MASMLVKGDHDTNSLYLHNLRKDSTSNYKRSFALNGVLLMCIDSPYERTVHMSIITDWYINRKIKIYIYIERAHSPAIHELRQHPRASYGVVAIGALNYLADAAGIAWGINDTERLSAKRHYASQYLAGARRRVRRKSFFPGAQQ